MRTSRAVVLLSVQLAVLATLVAGGPPPRPAAAATGAAAPADAGSSWASAGHDLGNSRSNPDEQTIGATNVSRLQPVWSRSFASNPAATPAVVDGVVYLADRSGALTAMDAATGAVLWTHAVSAYTGIASDKGRATPAVGDGRLIFGDQPPANAVHDGTHIVAVDATTGNLLWDTVVDTTPTAKITGAVTLDGDVAYVGVSSGDEANAQCCTFRGSVVALDATTGAVLWKTYTVPTGYTGGAVWGSGLVVDHVTGLLYTGTGNNYTVPTGVCETPTQTGCDTPADDDHVDSLLGLDLATGAVRWSLRTTDADVAVNSCRDPQVCGPDFDFGSSPNLLLTTIGGTPRRLVGIGSKSGQYWAADASTGALVWMTQVGPGGTGGGIQWGSSTDGTRIYVSVTNSSHLTWTLPSGTTTHGGMFSALDPATGAILWQTPDPQGAGDPGFVSSANGVVYAGSSAGNGADMYALDAATGAVLWSFAAGGSVMGGAAVVDGVVYWAGGYYSVTCPGPVACGTSYRLWAFGLPPADSAPTVPTTVVAQQTGATSVGLTWAAPVSPGGSDVTGYVVTRNGQTVAALPATARSATLTGLSPGVTYSVGVAARNASATGPAVTASVKASRKPTAPATLIVRQKGTGGAVVTWTPPLSSGATAVSGYLVTRDGAHATRVAASSRTFTVTGLASGSTHTFGVAAVNSVGTGPAATGGLTLTPTPTAPGTLTVAQAAPHDVLVSWAAPASAGSSAVTGYLVTRDGKDAAGAGPYSASLPASTTSVALTGLQQEVTYTVTVRAVNSAGAGAPISWSFHVST